MLASTPVLGLRLLVLGCGSIGERHIRNLRTLGVTDLLAFDPLPERAGQMEREFGVQLCPGVQEALSRRPDCVLVCTPPRLHTTLARMAVDAGAHVFVEKPLASALDGVDSLLDAAQEADRVLCVGYNLRFHAGLRKVKELLESGSVGRPLVVRAEVGQYLPDCRPNQDYRRSYTAIAKLGGGIILDASHEIDYVRWFAGEVQSVYCAAGRLSDLEMETEDTAALALRMSDGALAEIHMDCVQRGYARNCKVIGTEGTLIWDFGEGVRHLMKDGTWHGYPLVPDVNEMYVEEMRRFLACVRGEAVPMVDGATGRRVLEIALAAKESAAKHTEVVL